MENNIPPRRKRYRKTTEPALKQYIMNEHKQWEEVEFPVVIPTEKPAYRDALDYYLKGNPFLHHMDSEFSVNTIEEFYVKNKEEYIPLSDVLRSGVYSKRQKRKILRKNFNDWIKDYTREKHETIKVAESTFTMIGKVRFRRFGIFKQLLLILMFVVMMSFVYQQNNFVIRLFRPKIGSLILDSLATIFTKYRWAYYAINASLYGIILAVLVLKFIDGIQYDYQKQYGRAQRLLNNSKNILNRDFRRKSNHAKRYYLYKVLNNPYKYPPLRIEHVGETRMTIERFNNVSKQVIVSGAKIKRWNWFFALLRFILLSISYLGGIGLLGLIIFQLIKDFLN